MSVMRTDARATSRRPSAGYRAWLLVGGPIILVCALWYIADPTGLGAMAYLVAGATLMGIMMVGPHARGVRPRFVWIIQSASAVALLTALVGNALDLDIGGLAASDVGYIGTYACLILWLILLTARVSRRYDSSTAIDLASATIGSCLALWAVAVTSQSTRPDIAVGLVAALYPTLDVVLIGLALQLALRLGRTFPALNWLLASIALVAGCDVTYSITRVIAPDVPPTAALAAYLVPYFCLATLAIHPTVGLLSTPPPTPPPLARGRGLVFVAITISPVVLATALQRHGMVDTAVRAVLLVVLLALLFARLNTSIRALWEAEVASRRRATRDQLTGLFNRAALIEQLEHSPDDHDDGRHAAVLFIDCDDFKHVNDTWGHHAGDTVLRGIARRLPTILGPGDVVARHGGDEFVILTRVRAPAEAVALAERVREVFAAPLPVLMHRSHVFTASVGIAVSDADTSPADLLRHADTAMYEAKQSGRGGLMLFDERLARRSARTAAVGDRLAGAIREGALTVHLQPIMGGAEYEEVVGWEALARWTDPVLGIVTPDEFIPIAEQHGLIDDLGELVLHRACHDLATLRTARPDRCPTVHVNISPTQLLREDFPDVVKEAATAAGLPRGSVWLEVTETTFLRTDDAVLATLSTLRSAGIGVCIDDFGTGYASLATLLRLPVDCVKLDRSLVSRLGDEPEAHRQVGAVIALVRSMGITRIVAEGVETPEQADALKRLGCPRVQGWHYARPAPLADLLAEGL